MAVSGRVTAALLPAACVQVPPEPPEQAGRSLYERLEISGMRSQLLRRSADLKKNVSGSQQYLDVLREMSAVVSISCPSIAMPVPWCEHQLYQATLRRTIRQMYPPQNHSRHHLKKCCCNNSRSIFHSNASSLRQRLLTVRRGFVALLERSETPWGNPNLM